MEENMMLQWLTRDPLNGLLITIFFFISLIAGRYIREDRIAFVPEPGIKLLASILLIMGITLMKHWYVPAIICALCMIIALKLGRINEHLKKLVFPLLVAIFILIVQIYFGSMEYGLLVFSRVAASASVMILLTITTSHTDILESMRWLRLPRTMIEISSFMWRYITTFSNEGKKLQMAQAARGGLSQKGFVRRVQNITSICGLLITRAFARSDEVYRAMLSRGWKPDRRVHSLPVSRQDVIFGILVSLTITGLLVIDGFI